MFDNITKLQADMYKFIHDSVYKKGYPPSIREICASMQIKSISTVYAHLNVLEEKGYIAKDKNKKRSIVPLHGGGVVHVPVVNNFAADTPIITDENISDYIALPAHFAKIENVFAVVAKDDSMKNAGILEGDNVVVAPTDTFNNGDNVVVLKDNVATVTTYSKETCGNANVIGVVKGLLRIYQ